jgi:hypothetical protein
VRGRCSALLAAALASLGLVVEGTGPSRSERAPDNDPGWRNVGEREGRSAVYVGDGWVLTAAHVGAGPVVFEGARFVPVPGSAVALDAPGAPGRSADLVLFRVDPAPDLPGLKLRRSPVRPGTSLLMVGYGRGRGEPAGTVGYTLGPGAVKRWGTNRADASRGTLPGPSGSLTRCFYTEFSSGGTPHEAQASRGDSGGAVFARGAAHWKLAGIMLAVVSHEARPQSVAFYGDRTGVADLSFYRDQIHALMGRSSQKNRKGRKKATKAFRERASARPERPAGDAAGEP